MQRLMGSIVFVLYSITVVYATYYGSIHSAPLFFTATGATTPIYGQLTYPNAFFDAVSNRTFVTWESWDGVDRTEKIKYYDHTTLTWSSEVVAIVSGLHDDDHGVPAAWIDADGYIHVMCCAHGGPLKHSATTSPRNIAAWTAQADLGTNLTYPHPVMVGNTLYLFVRSGTSQELFQLYTATFAAGVASWSGPTTLVNISTFRFYAGTTILSPTGNGKIHIVASFANTTNPSSDFDDFYFIYNTNNGNIEDVAGGNIVTPGSFPINKATMETNYRFYTSPANTKGGIPAACFDSDNNPHVTFENQPSEGYPAMEVYHQAFVNGSWTSKITLGSDPNFDAAGGSGTACVPNTSGGVDNFFIQLSSPPFAIGGAVYKATCNNAGSSCGATSLVQQVANYNGPTPFALGAPVQVGNHHNNFRMLWTEFIQPDTPLGGLDTAPGIGTMRLWGYGDNGYVRGNP